ncbi:MAG: ACT domain-containing protein [Bryobacteraceae bacterium]
MSEPRLTLRALPQLFAVARLPAGAPLPRWATGSPWFSVTRTGEELSIVCKADAVPANVRCEKAFRALMVEGPLDFALTGILASLSKSMSDAKISLFAISTFDTDYILVRQASLAKAVRALRSAGHTVG